VKGARRSTRRDITSTQSWRMRSNDRNRKGAAGPEDPPLTVD
jgi:hypothetical protein